MTKIHPRTHDAAYGHLKQQTGDDAIELRPATAGEKALVRAKTLDNESVADAVVGRDSQGNEYLLGVYDDARTNHLNYQSALTTAIGLVPLVGPPVAALIALKDIGVAAVPMAIAKLSNEATSPTDRAVLRMGLKHLALSTASMASHGAAHYAMAAVEVSAASKDFFDSTSSWRDVPRAMWTAIKTLLSVREHGEEVAVEQLRVVVVRHKPAYDVTEPGSDGNPEQPAGPPYEE